MQLSPNAEKVMKARYLKPGETSEQRFRDVANAVAVAEERFGNDASIWGEHFYTKLFEPLVFLPNSPCIGNAGRPKGGLSACFVLPVPDSMEGIFQAVKEMAMIQKYGGGTGFSFSRLRAAGSDVGGTGGISSGPVSFMKVFDHASEAIKQGSSRRGANMGILHCDHPDIEEFIGIKSDMVTLQNFNISVAATDEFMAESQRAGTRQNRVFNKIVANAWRNGDPGLFFIDAANRDNPVPTLGSYEATNPCGEQPLLPYDSCNLGSIDLSKFVVDGRFDWLWYAEVIELAVRFLDDVIEVNKYPIPELDEMARATRKIGLGVMGFADALFKMGIQYDSIGGVQAADAFAAMLRIWADEASEKLAEERGVYPVFEPNHPLNKGKRYRNSTRTTIAPTGTLSILADCSGGIEPVFSLAFMRQHRLDRENPLAVTQMFESNKIFEAALDEYSPMYKQGILEDVANGASLENREELPYYIRKTFRTAHDVSPDWHIKMAAKWQEHIDAGVSKTINMPEESTEEDIGKAYLLAWSMGAKGVTVYRDNSRSQQVLTFVKNAEPALAPT